MTVITLMNVIGGELSSPAQIIILAVRPLVAPALASMALLPLFARADSTDRVAKTLTFSARKPVRLEATIADVAILGSTRTDISVEIVRRAPSPADLGKYPIDILESDDGVRILVVQERDGRDPRLRTEIALEVPSSAMLQPIRVFEGRVKLTGVRGACDVDVRRGAIEATALAGRVRLESGIGSIDVTDSELTPGGMMRLRVFNGPLRVRFARPPASARILAVTLNGALTSDIPLTIKDAFGPRFGEATIGSGDPVLSLDVVKGDIAIGLPR